MLGIHRIKFIVPPLIAALGLIISAAAANAGSVEFDGTGGPTSGSGGALQATALFSQAGNGDDLFLTLNNTATWGAANPTDILTAVLFNYVPSSAPPFTPTSATASSLVDASGGMNSWTTSTYTGQVNGQTQEVQNGGINVGAEWAGTPLAITEYGSPNYGVRSTGLGSDFPSGSSGNFGTNSGDMLDGVAYGIINAGGYASDANSGITGTQHIPLIMSSTVFDLGKYTGAFAGTEINNVTFIYGTQETGEASITGNGVTINSHGVTPTPEPAFLQLGMLVGLGGLAAARRKLRGQRTTPLTAVMA